MHQVVRRVARHVEDASEILDRDASFGFHRQQERNKFCVPGSAAVPSSFALGLFDLRFALLSTLLFPVLYNIEHVLATRTPKQVVEHVVAGIPVKVSDVGVLVRRGWAVESRHDRAMHKIRTLVLPSEVEDAVAGAQDTGLEQASCLALSNTHAASKVADSVLSDCNPNLVPLPRQGARICLSIPPHKIQRFCHLNTFSWVLREAFRARA
jgi:hypothetical protein